MTTLKVVILEPRYGYFAQRNDAVRTIIREHQGYIYIPDL